MSAANVHSALAPEGLAVDHRRLTAWLLGLCILAITHGSLYPWVFQAPADGWLQSWHRLWSWMDLPLWTNGGDVIGNVILFVPLGMLAWRASAAWSCGLLPRLAWVVSLSLGFATVLQIAQIWLPTRSAAISDVVWNALGLVLGIAVYRWAQPPVAWLSRRLHSPHLLAYGVALFWLVLQWWPLLPLLDRTVLRTAWFQLRQAAHGAPMPTLLAALAFMVLMHLLRGLRGRAWVAAGLLLTALVGNFFFVHKSGAVASEPSNAAGWCLGLLLGGICWALRAPAANRLVLAAAAVGGLLSSLQPFQFSATALPFQFIPVVGLFNEPRVAHTSAFLWAAFWVLALLLMVQRQGWRLPTSAAVLTGVLTGLEILQRWLPGQQADITPLLLPAACAWLLARLQQRQQRLHGNPTLTIEP